MGLSNGASVRNASRNTLKKIAEEPDITALMKSAKLNGNSAAEPPAKPTTAKKTATSKEFKNAITNEDVNEGSEGGSSTVSKITIEDEGEGAQEGDNISKTADEPPFAQKDASTKVAPRKTPKVSRPKINGTTDAKESDIDNTPLEEKPPTKKIANTTKAPKAPTAKKVVMAEGEPDSAISRQPAPPAKSVRKVKKAEERADTTNAEGEDPQSSQILPKPKPVRKRAPKKASALLHTDTVSMPNTTVPIGPNTNPIPNATPSAVANLPDPSATPTPAPKKRVRKPQPKPADGQVGAEHTSQAQTPKKRNYKPKPKAVETAGGGDGKTPSAPSSAPRKRVRKPKDNSKTESGEAEERSSSPVSTSAPAPKRRRRSAKQVAEARDMKANLEAEKQAKVEEEEKAKKDEEEVLERTDGILKERGVGKGVSEGREIRSSETGNDQNEAGSEEGFEAEDDEDEEEEEEEEEEEGYHNDGEEVVEDSIVVAHPDEDQDGNYAGTWPYVKTPGLDEDEYDN